MGLIDILKKLHLFNAEGLVKIEVKNYYFDNSQKIEVNDSQIITDIKNIGKQEITYPLPNAVEYDDVRKNTNELYKKGISGFVRKDLVLHEVGMLSARQRRKEIFRKFKGKIKPEHYHAMIVAYTVMEFEDKLDFQTSSKLMTDLVKKHKDEGRHIYNFCRSGLLEGFFWNELGLLIHQGFKGFELTEVFSKYFDDFVKFYPYAVWVAPIMDFDDVVEEIRIRLDIKEVTWLDIYFRGKDRMMLFENVRELLERKETLRIEKIERYTICNSPCIRITVRKTPDFSSF